MGTVQCQNKVKLVSVWPTVGPYLGGQGFRIEDGLYCLKFFRIFHRHQCLNFGEEKNISCPYRGSITALFIPQLIPCTDWATPDAYFFFLLSLRPNAATASSFMRFIDHIQRRTTVGGTPLDEWSIRRRDLYLTIHNNHNKPAAGFEPTISAGERPQTARGRWERPAAHYIL